MVRNNLTDDYYSRNAEVYLNIAKNKYSKLININEKDKITIIKRVATDLVLILMWVSVISFSLYLIITLSATQEVAHPIIIGIFTTLGFLLIIFELIRVTEDFVLHCIALILKDIEEKGGENNVLEEKKEQE